MSLRKKNAEKKKILQIEEVASDCSHGLDCF